MVKSPKDVLAGLLFIGLGLAFALGALRYDLGTALRMGPGYFPLVLGGVLALLGVVIAVGGLLGGEPGPIGPVPWRSVFLLVLALIFFGATVRGLGLVPALFGAALMSALASRRTGIVRALIIAAGLTVLCVAIFIEGLGVPIRLFGPWVGG